MFVSREARLELNCGLRDGVSTGDLRFQLHLVLNLRNVGRVPASAPFLRLKDVGWKLGASLGPIVSQRTGAGRTFGFYASRDVILHTGDEIGLAEFETGLDFRGTAQSTAPNAVQSIRKSEVFHTFRMVNWSGMAADGIQPNDYPIQVSGVYGAENAIASSFNFEIDKAQLLDLFAAHHNY